MKLKLVLELAIPSSSRLHDWSWTSSYEDNNKEAAMNQFDAEDGTTPIYHAFRMSFMFICDCHYKGESPSLQRAKAIINLLLERGANFNQTICVVQSGDLAVNDDSDSDTIECTALHLCVRRLCSVVDEELPLRDWAMEVVQMILVQGNADPNIVNAEGMTPLSRVLSLALNNGKNINLALDVANTLVQYGGRLTAPQIQEGDESQHSITSLYLLHDASHSGNMAILCFLLDNITRH